MRERTNIFLIISFLFLPFFSHHAEAAEQAETERLIRQMTPPLAVIREEGEIEAVGKKDEIFVSSFYEQSDILQGSSTGHWSELTNLAAYRHENIRVYGFVAELERFDVRNYTGNLGAYFNFKNSFIHTEIGFGWDITYIYRFQNIIEYSHKLYKTLSWQVGYSYRNYDTDDTHIVYPGLIYYFGDSYMSADWGVTYIESRPTGYFGTVKGDFAITDFLRAYGGIAFGQYLYDIYELSADEENGYVLFAGLSLKVYKDINFRAGYSYSAEEPKFIKRSVNFNLSVKF